MFACSRRQKNNNIVNMSYLRQMSPCTRMSEAMSCMATSIIAGTITGREGGEVKKKTDVIYIFFFQVSKHRLE